MISIDSLTFTLMFYAIMFMLLVVGILAIFVKNLYSVYHELYRRIGLIEINKQDDVSEYITDEEWFELCKEYGFDWDVKPYEKITHDSAVRLLEFLDKLKKD